MTRLGLEILDFRFCLHSIGEPLLHAKPNKRINQSTYLPHLSPIRVTCIKGGFFIALKMG
jgi:hypothetical protein